jgi:parallel beta-helix repeat protein
LLSILIFITCISTNAEAATISVAIDRESYYSHIQDALDAANPGDRIEVFNGTYYENLNIMKPVQLIGIQKPIIDAWKNGSAISIFADNATIDGFILRNSSISIKYPQEDGGIKLFSNNNVIQNNLILDNWDDIVLFYSDRNFIVNNTLCRAQEGLDLIGSNNNTISGNYILDNEDGIFIDHSDNNSIVENLVQNNSDDGIIVTNASEGNALKKNRVNGNRWHGLELFSSSNNIIIGNDANFNGVYNILLLWSNNNSILGNLANGGGYSGICLASSENNLIKGNEACYNNETGIILDLSNNNAIKYNNVSHDGMAAIGLLDSEQNYIVENSEKPILLKKLNIN